MGDKSGIQWTDASWNPTTGCTKVSPGCANCYIETTPPFRTRGIKFEQGRIPLRFYPDRLELPLRWRKPRRIFVNSMSDLFHEDIPGEFIDKVFAVMALADWHIFQILTKRPDRMLAYLSDPTKHERWTSQLTDGRRMAARRESVGGWADGWWPRYSGHIWFGVSVENQRMADERIPLLLKTPAAVRFLSCEPLLSEIDLSGAVWPGCIADQETHDRECDGGFFCDERNVDWVIVGGESGSGARACDIGWIRSIRDQCRAASVPCFVKQLGSNVPLDATGVFQCKFRDRKGGDPSEWDEDLRVREFPGAELCAHGRVEGKDCPDCAAEIEDCL